MILQSHQVGRPATLFLWGVVLVAGIWLRFWQLDIQILIDDEWHALHRLMQAGYAEIFLSFGHADYCIPMTLLFKALAESVGLYEWQMRLLPMLFGLAALGLIPHLLRDWLHSSERLCLGALIAISPLLVHFSRYVRPYALIVLLGFATVVLLWLWWRHGGRARAATFFVCAVAGAWLHPLTTLYTGTALTWFALAGVVGWRGGQGAWPFWRVIALGGVTTLACSALILPPLLADTASIAVKAGKHSIELQTLARTWEMVLGVGDSWLAVVLAIPVLIGAWALWQRDRLFVCYWLVLTLVAGIIIQIIGPEWVRNALVLVRYTVISVPFILALLAIGLVRIAILAVVRVGAAPAWAVAGSFMVVAGLYFAGPLPATYSGINQFTNSVRYQIDYDFERSIFGTIMTPLEIPAFYRSIARENGEWRVVEAAWHFETHYTPISQFQLAHQREVEIGMISGLCTDWTWGELPPDDEPGIRLGEFVFLDDILDGSNRVNRFVVFSRSRPFEYDVRSLPDIEPCIRAFRERFGSPWHESEDYVVFRLPRSGRESDS